MKKVLPFLVALLALASCVKEIKVTEVKVNPDKLDLVVGGKTLLKATVLPADATTTEEVAWSSSDVSVASVAPTGLVTAVAPGTATITAFIDGKSGTCAVTVSDTEIASVVIKGGSESAVVVAPGETKTLEIEINPADATNKNVSWTTSDDKIATVSAEGDGSRAVVKILDDASGIVDITVTTEIGAKTATQTFLVLGNEKLYVVPEEVYAGKPAAFRLNTSAYKGLSKAVWTVGEKEYEGDEAELILDVDQSLEDAIEGKEMGSVHVKLTAEISGVEVSDEFDVPVKVFWMIQPIDTWSRNSCPVFNKECTKVYFVTRNSDTSPNIQKRELVQVDLVNRTVRAIDLQQDKEKIKTDNGGMFCVNPANGDVIVANNQAIYCFTEALTKKWQFDVPGTNANTGASVMPGCGPAMSNKCDIVFAPALNHHLYALDAQTGAMIDELDFTAEAGYAAGLNNCQFAVWGENDIVLHRSTNSKCMHWISFKNNKFAIDKQSNSVTSSLADISCPVIDKTQTTAYFGGNSTILHIPIKGFNDALHLTGGATGLGLHFSGLIADGYLYCGSQVKSAITRVDLANPTAGFTPSVIESNGDNNRNFDSVSADEYDNIYFSYKVANKAMLMCKGKTADDGSFSFRVIASCPMLGGNYQGSSNVGDGYMVLCCRNAEGIPTIYVRCTGAKRGSGWSGMGGDVCNTKNANLVYAD